MSPTSFGPAAPPPWATADAAEEAAKVAADMAAPQDTRTAAQNIVNSHLHKTPCKLEDIGSVLAWLIRGQTQNRYGK